MKQVAEGFTQPLWLESLENQSFDYIVDKVGYVFVLEGEEPQDEAFLDLTDKIHLENWEQGLLGMAVHPDFRRNRKFYIRYSAPPDKDTPNGYSHLFILSEFKATDDFRSTVSGSERVLLQIAEPGLGHNGGGIRFGPDGYLYIAVGDGQGGNRDSGIGHVKDWYWINRGGNGQDTSENLLGSILRIDVDGASSGKQYAIPDDNPLVEEEGLDEHYAWGFRNPYRLSFDRDRLIVADSGEKTYEEMNVVESGGNYGWGVREGTACLNDNAFLRAENPFNILSNIGSQISVPGLSEFDFLKKRLRWAFRTETLPYCPTETPEGNPLKRPVVQYPYQPGGVTIGGFFYRNSTLPELENKLVFGDLLYGLFAAEEPSNGSRPWPYERLRISNFQNGKFPQLILSLGRDSEGELYVLSSDFSEGNGRLYRITPSKD